MKSIDTYYIYIYLNKAICFRFVYSEQDFEQFEPCSTRLPTGNMVDSLPVAIKFKVSSYTFLSERIFGRIVPATELLFGREEVNPCSTSH